MANQERREMPRPHGRWGVEQNPATPPLFPPIHLHISINNHGQGRIERKIFLCSHGFRGPRETFQGSIRVIQLTDEQNVELMQPVVKNAKSHKTEPGCQAYFFFVPEDAEEGKEEVMNGIEM
jgi:hypothetical protein